MIYVDDSTMFIYLKLFVLCQIKELFCIVKSFFLKYKRERERERER